MNQEQISSLNSELSEFESRKGSQIAVFMITTTSPESIEQYSIRVAEKWKVGRKQIDDGVILIVSKSDRKLRIEVGYGLEGVLTDAITKRIIDQIIVPRFKEDDFYGGILSGIRALISFIDGDAIMDPGKNQFKDRAYFLHYIPVLVVLALILSRILCIFLGRIKGSLITGFILMLGAWVIFGAFYIALAAGLIAFFISFIRVGFGINGSGGYGGGGRGGGGFGGGGSSGRW